MTYFITNERDMAIDVITDGDGPRIRFSAKQALFFSDVHAAEKELTRLQVRLLGKDKRVKTLKVSTYAKGWMS